MELTAQPCSEERAEHAEGPAWDAARGELLWVDIMAGRLWRASYDGGGLVGERSHDVGHALGAAVPAAAGGWMLAAGEGFAHLAADGSVFVLDQPESVHGGRTRMNDGKCDPAGRFWAGSMAWDARPGAGTLYRLGLDAGLTTVLEGVTVSNGLAWAPDGYTMYYIDTDTHRVDAFDFDPDTGHAGNRRPVVEIPPEQGNPDGMTLDDDGFLWVALWGGRAVHRYDPTGRHVATVHVPATRVSSCCFGGDDRSTLFITTSRQQLTEEQLAAEPDAGRVFRAEPGVAGPPATSYRGRVPSRT